MKILIAGFGSIGRRHYRNLRALGIDDIVLYRTGQSTLELGEIDDCQVVFSLQDALATKPDGVIIANPTSLHLSTAIEAARSGAHLLIEKPVSHSMQGMDELLEAVQNNRTRVLVGYQFRFHPALQAFKAAIRNHAVGSPLHVHAHWGEYLPDWHPWEDYRKSYSSRADLGGGVVFTLSHPFDYLRWMLGEFDCVCASIDNVSSLELEVEDSADVILSFHNGVKGSVHLDYFQRPASHFVEVIGSEGTLRWSQETGSLMRYSPEEGTWGEYFRLEHFDRNEMFVDEIGHFLELIANDTPSICSLQDGIKALEICLQVYGAARSYQAGEA